MNPLFKLGATVLGVIVKIASKDDIVGDIVDGVFQISEITAEDIFTKRNINRASEEISDNIAKSCAQILSHHKISDERAEVFFDSLDQILKQAKLTYDVVIAQKASVDTMYLKLSTIAQEKKSQFDPGEYDIFLRLIRHVSGIIVYAALESPRFSNHGIKNILSSMEELQDKTDKILQRLEEIEQAISRKTEDFQEFERRYRNNVAEKYGWIHLLGANSLERETKRYKLSIAYVALEARKGKNLSANMDLEDLFSKSNLLWIDGDAGSGKSTLMQWIAVNSASNNGDLLPDFKDSIPFLIELRKQDAKNISIKKAVDSVMYDSDCQMPDNWISKCLETGNAIVLIDGFDEVRATDRDSVLDWIEDYIAKYPKMRIVVTSRPQAGKNIGKKFARCRLLPMTREKVNLFLEYWHEAVLVDRLDVDKDEAKRYKNKLSVHIDNSEAIRRMVTNPLLCAMICALHFKNGSIMSSERNALYEDCCKMLFDNRDGEREIQAFAHIKLSYEEKKNILSQLAYWMMKNGLVVAEKEEVISRIKSYTPGFRESSQKYQAEDLYQYFLERSGILRSPEEGKIDFIHKSFQDYLAAYEISNQNDWGFIASKAGDVNWYETLILAMGFSRVKDSKHVIERILDRNNKEKNIIIAAACGSNAARLLPELRRKINDKLKEILPPKSVDASERLSGAGEFVVPYLKHKESMSADERYYSLNTLRMISSTQALAVAGSYLKNTAEPREIDLIGNMLEAYTRKELQSIDFEQIVIKYIVSASEAQSLYIPENFLRILSTAQFPKIGRYVSKIQKVTIVGFQNRTNRKLLSLFTEANDLAVIGNFNAISSVSDISNQLVSLVICDYSGKFDFYEMNRYPLDKLERFILFSRSKTYITGHDCSALQNIRELGLHLYNPMCEVLFDGFGNFTSLRSLSLYHEDIAEFSYSDLIDNTSLDRLVIKVPKYISHAIRNSIKWQIREIPTVVVKQDDDPYKFSEIY